MKELDIRSRNSIPDDCLIALAATLLVHGRRRQRRRDNSKIGPSQRRTHTHPNGIGIIVSAHKRLLQLKEETGTIRRIEKEGKIATSKVNDVGEDSAVTMKSGVG